MPDGLQLFTEGLMDHPREENETDSHADDDFPDETAGDSFANDSLQDLLYEKTPPSCFKAGGNFKQKDSE